MYVMILMLVVERTIQKDSLCLVNTAYHDKINKGIIIIVITIYFN